MPTDASLPVIRVRGDAQRVAPADHADLTFTVRRRASSGTAAVAAASEAYAALDRVLTTNAGAVERRTTVALSVQPVSRWDPETGREIREGFEATRHETVRFAPPAEAGDALRALAVAVPDLAIAGPSFGLRDDNPAHHEVRAAAAVAAREAATAYAAGLGLVTGAVRALVEPGLGPSAGDGEHGGPVPFAAALGKAALADVPDTGGPVLVELTGEDVAVHAAIVAEIELRAP